MLAAMGKRTESTGQLQADRNKAVVWSTVVVY